ncbi:hypothetical protein ACFVT2_19105 [Streptomyces sp. NPDC058000]|uniref:hypothetical protein n=1 Tax=Streptomyces sp. NPDC058000 TaxID=3346299 RepID=UPI0036E7508B
MTTPALLLRQPDLRTSGGWRALRITLTSRRMWLLFWCTVGTNGTFYAFSALWGGPLLTDGFGLSDVAASWYATASLALYGVGSLLTGLLSDRAGRRKPFVVTASVAVVLGRAGLAWTPWSPGWSAFALYGLVGLAAAQVTVSFAALKESVGSRGAATTLSVVNSGVSPRPHPTPLQPPAGRLRRRRVTPHPRQLPPRPAAAPSRQPPRPPGRLPHAGDPRLTPAPGDHANAGRLPVTPGALGSFLTALQPFADYPARPPKGSRSPHTPTAQLAR